MINVDEHVSKIDSAAQEQATTSSHTLASEVGSLNALLGDDDIAELFYY